MAIADHDFALEKLREFLKMLDEDAQALESGESPPSSAQRILLQPLIEKIAREVDPGSAGSLGETWNTGALRWELNGAINTTIRLVGILKNRDIEERIFGPIGPTLAASGLHPWVWHAAVNLWDGGHYKQAVNAAAAAVEEQTQLELDRGDLSGADLYTQAFKAGKVGETPDGRRLRFPHLDELTEDGKRNQSWVSAHEGAMHFGRGCAQGIRNLNAHGTGELPEQEALEYLAALSVLARWVDACEPVPAGTNDQA